MKQKNAIRIGLIRIGLLFLFVIAGAIVATSPAKAFSSSICGNAGTGYCLNNWNNGGSGNAVKMYYGGYANDNFDLVFVNACDGGFSILSSCESSWGPQGSRLEGSAIIEIQYIAKPTLCVVTTSTALAVLGTCAKASDGTGGANGVLMAAYNGPGCSQDYYVDRYWSGKDGQLVYLQSGGNPGLQAYFNLGSGTCWGNNQSG